MKQALFFKYYIGMSGFDLTNFGLYWTLDPERKIVIPEDFSTKIGKIKYNPESNSYIFFDKNGAESMRIKRNNYKSSGSYGKVYSCVPIKNIKTIMKEIQCTQKAKLENIIKEAIIQIIISDETASMDLQDEELMGPFVPYIYGVGYDPDENKCYILSERMENTLLNLVQEIPNIHTLSFREKDTLIISLLKKIMVMLAVLQGILNFNHRDLKLDNIMYKKTPSCPMSPILIDFGFSCITYKGLVINANDKFRRNFTESRDATQLLYNFAKYNKESMSENLYNACKAILTWNRRGTVCSLLDNQCGVQRWRNTYDFMNTLSGENPNGSPIVINKVLDALKEFRSWKNELVEYHVPIKENNTKNNTKKQKYFSNLALTKKTRYTDKTQ